MFRPELSTPVRVWVLTDGPDKVPTNRAPEGTIWLISAAVATLFPRYNATGTVNGASWGTSMREPGATRRSPTRCNSPEAKAPERSGLALDKLVAWVATRAAGEAGIGFVFRRAPTPMHGIVDMSNPRARATVPRNPRALMQDPMQKWALRPDSIDKEEIPGNQPQEILSSSV